jgi:hypothetical protein
MSVISRGGLICPTDDFLGQVKQLEEHFLSFHGDNLSKNVMKKLYERICKEEPSVFWKSALIMTLRYPRERAEVDRKKRRAADTTISVSMYL